MKIKLQTILTLCFVVLNVAAFAQSNDEKRSVPGYAEINKSSGTITLKWEVAAHATAYKIYRRDLGSSSWGSPQATLSATDSVYEDNSVTTGVVYEYAIEKVTTFDEPFSTATVKLLGYSYISASIEKPAVHTRGNLWIYVAKNINDSLTSEISELQSDLVGDGWNVEIEVVDVNATVSSMKSSIMAKYDLNGCDAVYLLGHLPVPYSGMYCQDANYPYPPDGHDAVDANSHCGAWPADSYYGSVGGTWTDLDSTTLAKRDENNNAIGDGKFDNAQIAGTASIAVGRVDFSDMPAFSESEIELTRRYLNKAHQFKIGNTVPLKKGIHENNFAPLEEGFGSGAVRDFTSHFGKEGIVYGDLFTTTASDDYLFAYVCGAGWYTSCNGLGNTADFTTKNAAVFNHIFGSFFGDYDIENNFMRATLATEDMGLVCVWSGRPKWITHTLAMGETYGDVTLRTQNNTNQYDGNFYRKGAHIALLGDPSLRTEMILPATNVQLVANGAKTEVDISWTASSETSIDGYYVYRSHSQHGNFELLNTTPIMSLTLTDNTPWEGTNYYMVRTTKETENGSGSYKNLSIGTIAEISAMNGPSAGTPQLVVNQLKVYPTLTNSTLIVEATDLSTTEYSIINNLSAEVLSGKLVNGSTIIQVQSLTSGIYYLKNGNAVHKFVKY
ncbi:MAG: T9SS type A sorting domain-containing protein [Bacteroidia bacterium]|nr:T9SS type A sorting domain-containing protein [Bacteroidia bacterium]